MLWRVELEKIQEKHKGTTNGGHESIVSAVTLSFACKTMTRISYFGEVSPVGFCQNLENPEVEEIVEVGRPDHNSTIGPCSGFGRGPSHRNRLFNGDGPAVSSHNRAFDRHLHPYTKKAS